MYPALCVECSCRYNQDQMVVVWSDPYGHYDSEYICVTCYSYKTHEIQDQIEPATFDYEESED